MHGQCWYLDLFGVFFVVVPFCISKDVKLRTVDRLGTTTMLNG